jgi:hypothetical protein
MMRPSATTARLQGEGTPPPQRGAALNTTITQRATVADLVGFWVEQLRAEHGSTGR